MYVNKILHLRTKKRIKLKITLFNFITHSIHVTNSKTKTFGSYAGSVKSNTTKIRIKRKKIAYT